LVDDLVLAAADGAFAVAGFDFGALERFAAALVFGADAADGVDFALVLADVLADVLVGALVVVLDFARPVERRVVAFLSPIGSALPTAFTAPLATSPTVPATFPAVPATLPAVRPTFFTTSPASGMACPPVRPVTEAGCR
jgi:hypothetical protein